MTTPRGPWWSQMEVISRCTSLPFLFLQMAQRVLGEEGACISARPVRPASTSLVDRFHVMRNVLPTNTFYDTEVSAMDDSQEEYDEQQSLLQTATVSSRDHFRHCRCTTRTRAQALTNTYFVQDTLLFPLRVAISPPLLRTYLRTLLLLIASAVLFAFAAIAYTSFYYSYIPIHGLSVPVYLQFDHGAAPGILVPSSERRFGQESQKWPHGIADLYGLVTRQRYDVRVEIRVPRSRANLDAGNWMLDLALRAPARVFARPSSARTTCSCAPCSSTSRARSTAPPGTTATRWS